jgi:hypothetical protein
LIRLPSTLVLNMLNATDHGTINRYNILRGTQNFLP